MKINAKFYIAGKRGTSDTIVTDLLNEVTLSNGVTIKKKEFTTADDAIIFPYLKRILAICSNTTVSTEQKNDSIAKCLKLIGIDDQDIIQERLIDNGSTSTASSKRAKAPTAAEASEAKLVDAINRMIEFFKEFNFTPSFRFLNSFALATNKATYVRNYFAVQDHPYAAEVSEKIKSAEFKRIMTDMSACSPKPINTRFELYFGEPGTGKTTYAATLAPTIMVCSSDMLPSDLMQNFGFSDGKAEFEPSDLWKAMEEGTSIVLDEVNMLPFESLRFLQGITDGKESIDFKGHKIKIHPNFKIYATMNLNVNGQCIPLPAPLVDRSYDIREFTLTAEQLLSAVL